MPPPTLLPLPYLTHLDGEGLGEGKEGGEEEKDEQLMGARMNTSSPLSLEEKKQLAVRRTAWPSRRLRRLKT